MLPEEWLKIVYEFKAFLGRNSVSQQRASVTRRLAFCDVLKSFLGRNSTSQTRASVSRRPAVVTRSSAPGMS